MDETLTEEAAALAATGASDVESTLGSDAGLEVTEEAAARYDLRREFGRGGQAVVFLAFDAHVGREVAFKQQLRSDADARRFLQEGRITGTLEHPGIVPVYEIGRRSDGSYYYTQKLVRGKTLRQALAECTGLEQRTRLLPQFLGVCQAVAYAHSRGVIHRDLKPENVMIGEFGEAIVLDWGLAKRLGDVELPGSGTSGEASESLTREGALLGTPLYMSPEQAEGRLAQVDRRSDVFSLGAMLYELLAGRTPFAGATVAEVIENVANAAVAPLPTGELRVAPELAAVAVRALAKEPSERFTDAQGLANELASFLAGRRIASYEYSSLELLRRFIKKNRALVTFASALLFTIGVATILLVRSEARARRNLLMAKRSLADELLERATDAEKSGRYDLAAGYFALAGTQVDEPRARWSAALAYARAPEAAASGEPIVDAKPSTAVVSSDGRWMGIKFRTHFRVRDLQTSRWVYAEPVEPSAAFFAASLDGRVATAMKHDIAVRRWDRPAEVVRWKSEAWVRAITFLPDGRLVLGRLDGKLELCGDTGSCRVLQIGKSQGTALAASADGKFVILGSSHTLYRVEVASGRIDWQQDLGSSGVRAIAVSKEGDEIAVGTYEGEVWIADAKDGRTTARLAAPDQGVGSLAFSDDGVYLAVGTFEGAAYLFRPPARSPVAMMDGGGAAVRFDAEQTLTLVGHEGQWQRVPLAGLRGRWRVRDPHEHTTAIASCAEGRWLSGGSEGHLLLWPKDKGLPVDVGVDNPLYGVACSKDGRTLLGAFNDGRLRRWDSAGRVIDEVTLGYGLSALVVLDNGDVIVGDDSGKVVLADHDSRRPPRVLGTHGARIKGLALLGPRAVVSVAGDGKARVWDLASGAETGGFQVGASVTAVAASPDGGTIVTAGRSPEIHVWDAITGRLRRTLPSTAEMIEALALSADGRTVAAGASDRQVQLWAVETGVKLGTIRGMGRGVTALGWSADGTLALGDFGGTVAWLRIDPAHVAMAPAAMLEEVKRRFHLVQEGVQLRTSWGEPTKPD